MSLRIGRDKKIFMFIKDSYALNKVRARPAAPLRRWRRRPTGRRLTPSALRRQTGMINDTNFLKSLFRFSQVEKDMINEETVELLLPYIEMEGFTAQVARNASKAAEGLCIWVRAMVRTSAPPQQGGPRRGRVTAGRAAAGVVPQRIEGGEAQAGGAAGGRETVGEGAVRPGRRGPAPDQVPRGAGEAAVGFRGADGGEDAHRRERVAHEAPHGAGDAPDLRAGGRARALDGRQPGVCRNQEAPGGRLRRRRGLPLVLRALQPGLPWRAGCQQIHPVRWTSAVRSPRKPAADVPRHTTARVASPPAATWFRGACR